MMYKNTFGASITSVCFLLAFVSLSSSAHAQRKGYWDSSYIQVFPNTLTARVYGIHKYQQFTIPSNDNSTDLKYIPNTKYSLGAGLTYKNLTANGALGFGFLNNDDDKGDTKSFDLQVNAYPQNWIVNLFLVFHKGEHLEPQGFSQPDLNGYYYRPDVKSQLIGAAAYRVANSTKYSFRAAVLQNEIQKKSAGTLLYGGQFYYGSLKGDSTLVPFAKANSFNQFGTDKITYITFGPGIGYSYTLVIAQNLYLMGAVIGNIDVNIAKEFAGDDDNNKVSVLPAAAYRAAVGYNSPSWGVSGTWLGTAILFKGKSTSDNYYVPTGFFSVAISKKIFLNKKLF